MTLKKKIEAELTWLKERGHGRGKIEARLGYSENAIDQSLARGGSEKLYKIILLYKDAILNQSSELDEAKRQTLLLVEIAKKQGVPEKRINEILDL